MQVRRSLAAVLAVGSLLLATACAGDDLSDASLRATARRPSSGGDKGTVPISGQNFPEADAGRRDVRRSSSTNAGYSTDVKLVDARDAYMATFPDERRHRPGVRRRHRQLPQRRRERRERRAARPPATARSSPTRARRCSTKQGITLLDLSEATDTNAFFVTKDFAEARGRHQALRPRGQVSVVLAAAPDCEGRLDCEGGLSDEYGIDVTEVLPLGYASDQTYQSVIDGESAARRDQHHRRHAGAARASSCSRTTSRSSRRRTSCRRSATTFLADHPDVAGHPQPADGAR